MTKPCLHRNSWQFCDMGNWYAFYKSPENVQNMKKCTSNLHNFPSLIPQAFSSSFAMEKLTVYLFEKIDDYSRRQNYSAKYRFAKQQLLLPSNYHLSTCKGHLKEVRTTRDYFRGARLNGGCLAPRIQPWTLSQKIGIGCDQSAWWRISIVIRKYLQLHTTRLYI